MRHVCTTCLLRINSHSAEEGATSNSTYGISISIPSTRADRIPHRKRSTIRCPSVGSRESSGEPLTIVALPIGVCPRGVEFGRGAFHLRRGRSAGCRSSRPPSGDGRLSPIAVPNPTAARYSLGSRPSTSVHQLMFVHDTHRAASVVEEQTRLLQRVPRYRRPSVPLRYLQRARRGYREHNVSHRRDQGDVAALPHGSLRKSGPIE